MAKRGAAALACHAPGCESFAAPLLKRRRGDPERKEEEPRGGGGGGLKRKRAAEGEEAAKAAKRPSSSSSASPGQRRVGDPALQEQEPRPPESGSARGGRPQTPLEEPEDDVWRYNSFQYWRSPLPALDLSDILDLEKGDATDARHSSSVCLSEMET